MNIRADGDESKFDFGETMSVNLVSVLTQITKVTFRYIVMLYKNIIYSMPTTVLYDTISLNKTLSIIIFLIPTKLI